MFYWSYKDVHVALSDDEEMALVQKLGRDHLEHIGYHTSKKVRENVEKRIFRYFERSLHADPEAFNRRYVFRSCYGKDAQKMFPVLLGAMDASRAELPLVHMVRNPNWMNSQRVSTMRQRTTCFRLCCSRRYDGPGHSQ